MREYSITLGEQPWKLRFKTLKKDRGSCWLKRRVLLVDENLPPLEQVEVTLHEAIHGLFPWLDEKYVDDSAKDLAHILLVAGLLNDDCEA